MHRFAASFVASLALVLALHSPAAAQITVETLTSSAVSEVGPYYQDVQDAINRFFSRDVEGARNLLNSAKKKTPQLAPPEVMLAQLFIATGQGPNARQELERAIQKYPGDPEAYLMLADGAFSDQRITEAGLLFAKAGEVAAKFSENPKRKENAQMRAYAGKAAVAETREDWAGAKADLTAWTHLEPNNAAPHQRLARVLFKLGDKKGAYAELQAAEKADPKLPPAEVTMGNLYAQDNDKAQAEKFMTAAARKGARDLATNLALMQWNLQNNRLSDAKKYADTALQVDPNSLDAKLACGIVAWMQKDYPAAKKFLEDAHEQSPGNSVVINQLALVLLEQKDEADRQRALEFAQLNQKLNPNSAEAAATLGWIAYRMGRKADAQRALNAIVQTGNLTPLSAYYVAYVLKDQGQLPNAIKLLEGALNNSVPFAYRDEAESLLADLKAKMRSTAAEESRKK